MAYSILELSHARVQDAALQWPPRTDRTIAVTIVRVSRWRAFERFSGKPGSLAANNPSLTAANFLYSDQTVSDICHFDLAALFTLSAMSGLEVTWANTYEQGRRSGSRKMVHRRASSNVCRAFEGYLVRDIGRSFGRLAGATIRGWWSSWDGSLSSAATVAQSSKVRSDFLS